MLISELNPNNLSQITGVDVPDAEAPRVIGALQLVFPVKAASTVQGVRERYGEDALREVTEIVLATEGWWGVVDALLALIDWPGLLVVSQLADMCKRHSMWGTPLFSQWDTDSVLAPLVDKTKRSPDYKPFEIGMHVLFRDVRETLIDVAANIDQDYKALTNRLYLLVRILDALKMAYSKHAWPQTPYDKGLK